MSASFVHARNDFATEEAARVSGDKEAAEALLFPVHKSDGNIRAGCERELAPEVFPFVRGEGQALMPVDLATFKYNFETFTNGALVHLPWKECGLVAAGGAVLACLTHTPREPLSGGGQLHARPSFEAFHGAGSSVMSSDVDLFLVNDTKAPEAAASEVYQAIRRAVPSTKCCLTKNTVTFFSAWPNRPVQLNLSVFPCAASHLLQFDLDACAVCYDGGRVLALPRFLRAVATRTNLLRVSLVKQVRCDKYAARGVGSALPPFVRGTERSFASGGDVDTVFSLAKLGTLRAAGVPVVGEGLSEWNRGYRDWKCGWYAKGQGCSWMAGISDDDFGRVPCDQMVAGDDEAELESTLDTMLANRIKRGAAATGVKTGVDDVTQPNDNPNVSGGIMLHYGPPGWKPADALGLGGMFRDMEEMVLTAPTTAVGTAKLLKKYARLTPLSSDAELAEELAKATRAGTGFRSGGFDDDSHAKDAAVGAEITALDWRPVSHDVVVPSIPAPETPVGTTVRFAGCSFRLAAHHQPPSKSRWGGEEAAELRVSVTLLEVHDAAAALALKAPTSAGASGAFLPVNIFVQAVNARDHALSAHLDGFYLWPMDDAARSAVPAKWEHFFRYNLLKGEGGGGGGGGIFGRAKPKPKPGGFIDSAGGVTLRFSLQAGAVLEA